MHVVGNNACLGLIQGQMGLVIWAIVSGFLLKTFMRQGSTVTVLTLPGWLKGWAATTTRSMNSAARWINTKMK